MKKILAVVLSLALLTGALAGCGGDTKGTDGAAAVGSAQNSTAAANPAGQETAGENGEEPFRVCLIVALLGTRSFADFAYDGCQKAVEDFGIELTVSECEDTSLYENQLLTACEEGYDLIICGASQWKDYIANHAAEYPDTLFGISDTRLEGIPNVFSITFAQNQGSFLTGALSAMFTEMTEFENVNEETVIGWVGGTDIPALRDFYTGFEEGAKYINPDITILQSFAGDMQDAVKGKELTLAMYQQGADIVCNVAGNTGLGVLEAAAQSGYYAIGVDKNQDDVQPGSVVTSMLKSNETATYYMIENAVKGTYPGGQHLYLDLAYGGVGLTDFSVFREYACKTEEQQKRLDEILVKLQELEDKIVSGEIVVSNYEGYGPN